MSEFAILNVSAVLVTFVGLFLHVLLTSWVFSHVWIASGDDSTGLVGKWDVFRCLVSGLFLQVFEVECFRRSNKQVEYY